MNTPRTTCCSSGFTLVEVLVSLLVMSIPVGGGQTTATITIHWDDSVAAWAFGTPAAAAPNPMTFTLESAL